MGFGFRVLGVSGFGVSGFRGGVVMTFVCHKQDTWFSGFGVSGWGRDDIRFA